MLQHKGMWAGYDANAVAAAETARTQAALAAVTVKERKTDYKQVVITEVEDATTVWTQSPDTTALTEVMKTIRTAFQNNPPVKHAIKAKRNDLVAAQFSLDQGWYRARILNVSGNDVEVC
jgi:staphylococcal nuclease domain-containing protein 1